MDPIDASNVIHARSDMNALTPFVLTLHDQVNVITLVSVDNNRYGRLLFLVELEDPTTFRPNTCQMSGVKIFLVVNKGNNSDPRLNFDIICISHLIADDCFNKQSKAKAAEQPISP